MRISSFALVFGIVVATGACGPRPVTMGPGARDHLPPPQREGTVVQPWEHYCVYPDLNGAPLGKGFDAVLEAAGKPGFEMVGLIETSSFGVLICFKRPVTEAPAPNDAQAIVSPAAPGA